MSLPDNMNTSDLGNIEAIRYRASVQDIMFPIIRNFNTDFRTSDFSNQVLFPFVLSIHTLNQSINQSINLYLTWSERLAIELVCRCVTKQK